MLRRQKPLIYIFCEGESEIEYAKCLKEKFSDVAVIKRPVKGLFSEAENKFKKDPRYRNYTDVTDEIWFFFDIDNGQAGPWNTNYNIIKKLRKLRSAPGIRIRLLMTTGCIEYWFLLHYKKTRPSILTQAEKDRITAQLKHFVPTYYKGDPITAKQISTHIDTAVNNGDWALKQLKEKGLPGLEDTDFRTKWLYECTETFTTVQEAITYLESLSAK